MNQILKEILQIQNWKNLYDSFTKKNNLKMINSKLVNHQNFQNFQNFIETIIEKGPRKSKKRWVSNEKRILYVILNCISVIQNITVEEFKTQEIQRLNRVFQYKDKHSIHYEIRKLSSNNQQNRRRWSQKEQNLLQVVVTKSTNKNKWNEIARQLFIASKGEYFRQGKHCRQRFYKMKSCKGSEQNFQDISLSAQMSNENSLKFHSRSNSDQQNPMEIQVNIKLNLNKISLDSNNHKKQPNNNENLIFSNTKGQFGKRNNINEHEDQKGSLMNIKTSKSIKSQQKKQPQKILIFSQNVHQMGNKQQDQLKSFMNVNQQQCYLNYINSLTIQSLQKSDHSNNIAQGSLPPSTAYGIHINNFLGGNIFFNNTYQIVYPPWTLSSNLFNFQQYSFQ